MASTEDLAMSKHMRAIERYAAHVIDPDRLPKSARAQAIKDRKRYGDWYIPKKDCEFERMGLLLLFMVEVCNIPLTEARITLTEFIWKTRAFYVDRSVHAADTARAILCGTGHVLLAQEVI